MNNVEQTIISQYANSPILLQLIHNMNQYIDQSTNLNHFFKTVWNLSSASGFGLDIWGRILGVSRILTVPAQTKFFGFFEAMDSGGDSQPFDQAPFFSNVVATQNYFLADAAYQRALFVKALTNISSCTIPAMNQLLQNLFASRGQAYVIDTGNMTMTLNFTFALEPFELALLQQSAILPHPTGVLVTIVQA